ncbi:MAG: YegS/Rv2252/BmrU family lipid kinase [Rikenellaceae bacterium]
MKQAVFLYNTHAGDGKIGRYADEIVEILASGGYSVHGESIDYARDPFERFHGVDLVVVAGGDGTVNHVVNQMKERGVGAALAVIPSGTTNDFAESLGMSHKPLRAAAQIASGTVDYVDCGYVNGLYFVNVFSFGLLTTTSRRITARFQWLAKLKSILAAIDELATLKSMKLQIEADGGRFFNPEALLVLVLNGSKAGGFRFARGGALKDGLLDCVVARNKGHLRAVIALVLFLFGAQTNSVKSFRARTIQILSDEYEPTDADGERGVDFPLNIECLAGELKVIIPSL